MNTFKISEEAQTKEILIKNEEDKSFFFDLDIEEKYNKLYSNFDIKERKYDFWETINNKLNSKRQKSITLDKLHHLLDYKDYDIIDNQDFSFSNNTFNNIEKYSPKMKKGGNKKIFNFNKKNNSMKLLSNQDNPTYELNLDINNVYNRLYNRGFYIKNKNIIKKIKNDEIFSKTMSDFSYVNPNSQKILLLKNNYNDKKKKININVNYYDEDITFKPNIDKNSIKIANRLQKRGKYENEKSNFENSFNNDDKKKINQIKYNIFRNNYKNLFNYFNKSKYSNYNKNLNKSESQRIMSLRKRNIELSKNKNKEIEKNNDAHVLVKSLNKRKKEFHIYENNKKWKNSRDEKIKKIKEIKETIEISENRKNLDLPGKQNYEKYKNLIIKIFSPKEKIKTYSQLKKKNNTRNKNEFNNNSQKDIKIDENISNSKNKKIKASNYHRQIFKYVNNEGKELFLFSSYINNKNNNYNYPKKNNMNFGEFAKLVQENNIDIKNIKNKCNNKLKSQTKINKIKKDKYSLEYKMKYIKKAFSNEKKIKNK